ncbi:MAG: ribbon-helix-helix domain-containing protein [Candidatus Helarchaeota archaeon]
MSTLPIKLKKELIEKIDYLVRIGRYPNRSAAIREIIEEKLADRNYFIEDSIINWERIYKILQELTELKEFTITFTSRKSATELVSEGRER